MILTKKYPPYLDIYGQYPRCYTEYPENTENPEYSYRKHGKLRKTQNTPTENTENPEYLYGKLWKTRKTQNTQFSVFSVVFRVFSSFPCFSCFPQFSRFSLFSVQFSGFSVFSVVGKGYCPKLYLDYVHFECFCQFRQMQCTGFLHTIAIPFVYSGSLFSYIQGVYFQLEFYQVFSPVCSNKESIKQLLYLIYWNLYQTFTPLIDVFVSCIVYIGPLFH